MSKIIDKRQRSWTFRTRLQQAMRDKDVSQSALARNTGVDRSTISQLMTDDGARLPNSHVAGCCAEVLGVSADWLLGLSDRPENAADLLSNSLTMTEAPRALVDERIFQWHREAAGYKIRHVPAALPDMLKTQRLLEWEYGPHLGRTTDQAIGASADRFRWMRSARSDYEIAMPLYELDSFASGTGFYEGVSAEIRMEQLERFLELSDTFYPRLRLYLFDARRLFSSPITVFGPLLCVIYVGSHYMAFRDRDRVDTLTEHFDRLVREASVSSRAFPDHVTRLMAKVT